MRVWGKNSGKFILVHTNRFFYNAGERSKSKASIEDETDLGKAGTPNIPVTSLL